MTPTVPSPGRSPPGAVTSLCARAAAAGTVGSFGRRLFTSVNGLPDLLRAPLWLVPTVGVLGTSLVAAAAALVLRYRRPALAAALLVPAKLGVERELLKALVPRERPDTTIPGAVLRDVPSAGPSFPSGHAVIATCAGAGSSSSWPSRCSTRWPGSTSARTLLSTSPVARVPASQWEPC